MAAGGASVKVDNSKTKLNLPEYPDDGCLVGSDDIFSSPNVLPPPNTKPESPIPLPPPDDGIPAPSIYFDDRGEIHNVRVYGNNQRINILYTKAGYLRSGDLHPNEQCDFIFSGRVNVWTLSPCGSTKIDTYTKHDFVKIPRGVPHVFEFVEDTVMAEWWEPQGFQAWFYKPYRDIVDASIGSALVEKRKQGLVVLGLCSSVGTERTCYWNTVWMVVGAAAMCVMGFALGRSHGNHH